MPAEHAVTEHAVTEHAVTEHAVTNGHVLSATTVRPAGTVPPTTPVTPGGVTDAWTVVVHDVRTLTLKLADAGVGVVRQLSRPTITMPALPAVPALAGLQSGWSRVEDSIAREVKTRLERVEDRPGHPHAARTAEWVSPADLLEDLLTASEGNATSTARDELYRALLLRLVPDEARLVATLADGTAYPLLHVQTRSRTVLSNISTLAEVAQLTLPEAGETYIAHLLALGLAEEGPEDERLAGDYDRLLARARVRAAEDVAREDGRLGTRIARRTVRISRLGAELWLNCHTPAVPEAA